MNIQQVRILHKIDVCLYANRVCSLHLNYTCEPIWVPVLVFWILIISLNLISYSYVYITNSQWIVALAYIFLVHVPIVLTY